MAELVVSHDVFVMHGARAALADGLAHVEQQVTALERAVVENPGLAFDLARTLVESTCRTILSERKQSYESSDDLPKLFKTVTTFLPLSPPSANGSNGGRDSLKKTVNGLHTALQGVCELRNDFGFASHGSDGSRPRMETIQALLAAQAADTIVGFLHSTHRQDQNVQKAAPPRYEDRSDFNDEVDEAHGNITICAATFRASEVLFRLDHEAYRDALASFDAAEDEQDSGSDVVPPSTGEEGP